MRLLELDEAGDARLSANFITDVPPYAILSHTWGNPDEEVTLIDISSGEGISKPGYQKIRFCGRQARQDGLKYFWVDTCCIDKSNSTELTEAINSMYRWYQNAQKCYVFLADVSQMDIIPELEVWDSFMNSRWFTRGWTLQELIAPTSVEFFSQEGCKIGDKQTLEWQICHATPIPAPALRGVPMKSFSIMERMSWQEPRDTTRDEDKAYSLLGICGVHIPLIYGEGRQSAFRRLRREMEQTMGPQGITQTLLPGMHTLGAAQVSGRTSMHEDQGRNQSNIQRNGRDQAHISRHLKARGNATIILDEPFGLIAPQKRRPPSEQDHYVANSTQPGDCWSAILKPFEHPHDERSPLAKSLQRDMSAGRNDRAINGGSKAESSAKARLVHESEHGHPFNPAQDKAWTDPHLAHKALRESVERILKRLRFDEMESRYDTMKSPDYRTCRWLSQTAEYKRWHDQDLFPYHNGFFWLKGKPGTGKSTLMKSAFSEAKSRTDDAETTTAVIAYFFSATGTRLERSVEGMFRSFICQLLDRIPRLHTVISSHKLILTGTDKWPCELLRTWFRTTVMLLNTERLTCYVDALDECSQSEDEDIRGIVEFFEELSNMTVEKGIHFRVCFSSRHYPHISVQRCEQLVLENREEHEQDVATYIQARLKLGTMVRVNELKAAIQDMASGIFLWVVLVVRILNEEHDGGNIHHLRKRLDEIPKGLDELFEDILRRGTNDVRHLVLTLQLVLYARRPLKRGEIYHALLSGLEPTALARWDPPRDGPEATERFILSCSKGLVELTKREDSREPTVQFIHESVRTYLRDIGMKTLDPKLGSNLAGASEERLRQCCETYISQDILEGETSAEIDSDAKLHRSRRKKTYQAYPFLAYAVGNIFQHANVAQSAGLSQHSFLERFAIERWLRLWNLLEKYKMRQYGLSVTVKYVLAELGCRYLLVTEVQRNPILQIEDARYGSCLGAAVAQNDVDEVDFLLSHGADPRIGCRNGNSILELACNKGSADVLALLLRHSACREVVKASNGTALLCQALAKAHIGVMRVLLQTGTATKEHLGNNIAALFDNVGWEGLQIGDPQCDIYSSASQATAVAGV